MTDWMPIFNLSSTTAALFLSLLFLAVNSISLNIVQKTRSFFAVFFTILSLYTLCHLLSYIVGYYTSKAALLKTVIFLHSLFSSMLMPMITIYMLNCCGEDWKKSRVFRITSGLWILYLILLIFTQFTTVIYYVTPDGSYRRGPYYPVLLIPLLLIMTINLITLFNRRPKFSARMFNGFLIYFLAPMLGMIIQMLFYGLNMIVLGTTLASIVLFLIIYSDQVDESIRQQEENIRLQASAAVLQMRPHFIYNVMTSIYYLIQQDPKKAQQVTLDFTTYLRKNFTAIAREEPIPFTSELEHTRAYLAVELVRFEGQLLVESHVEYTAFHLPPLTLQPIVENAVKHGLDPERGPLSLSVTTRKTDDGSEIIVEDNGPGFDGAENNEPHVALNNISRRLASMCGGTLEIKAAEPSGTRVRIFIPKEMKKQ